MASITVTVDGVTYTDDVEPRLLLVHYLRERLGKTGTPIGCDTSNCGACTVTIPETPINSQAMVFGGPCISASCPIRIRSWPPTRS